MMSTRKTSALEEEVRADEEKGREVGAVEAASVVSTRGSFVASCVALL